MSTDKALAQARRMERDGAAIIDIGGESTRPGAQPVSLQEELDRVLPVVERLTREIAIPISIDTSKPLVMSAAIRAGANMVNDVYALREAHALEVISKTGVPVCLMHMRGKPRTMQQHPTYGDVVAEVKEFLRDRIAACVSAGIDVSRIIVDPGFGFGKTPNHNLELINRLADFTDLGCPILVGVSRKSSIGAILDRPVDQRLAGGLALTAMALLHGAAVIRTHDVAATVDVIHMMEALARVR